MTYWGYVDIFFTEFLNHIYQKRFKEIIQDAIDKKETKKLDLFVNESKKKAAKRKAHYEKEAKEAEELKKKIGVDDSQDSLR